MLSNEELIQLLKAQITTSVGGQASPQDVEKFVDLAVDQTAVLQDLRVEKNIKSSLKLNSIELGEPAMVKATEGTDPASADVVTPSFGGSTLTPVEVLMAYDVTFSFLEQNIEGNDVNEALNRIFAKRFGKDTVQLIFNGDTATSPVSTRTDKLLVILDGFIKQALADSTVNDYTISGTDYLNTIFPGMLKLLPKDYKDQRSELAYFVSADVYDAYADQIGSRATALGDMVLVGDYSRALTYKGIQLRPVFGLGDTDIILTLKRNLVVGYGRDMTIGRDIDNRARVVKVTITAKLDAKYIVGDAIVLGQP